MINTILEYWDIKTKDEQIFGSSLDIYAETIDKECYMIIEDGNCKNQLNNGLYHIYLSETDGKIFEGRIICENDFIIIMKSLGINKK